MTSHSQNTDQTDAIIARKVQQKVNQKVLKDMKKAVDEIEKNDIESRYFAAKGIAILLILIAILSFIFF